MHCITSHLVGECDAPSSLKSNSSRYVASYRWWNKEDFPDANLLELGCVPWGSLPLRALSSLAWVHSLIHTVTTVPRSPSACLFLLQKPSHQILTTLKSLGCTIIVIDVTIIGDSLASRRNIRTKSITLGLHADPIICSILFDFYLSFDLAHLAIQFFNSAPSKDVSLWNTFLFAYFKCYLKEN